MCLLTNLTSAWPYAKQTVHHRNVRWTWQGWTATTERCIARAGVDPPTQGRPGGEEPPLMRATPQAHVKKAFKSLCARYCRDTTGGGLPDSAPCRTIAAQVAAPIYVGLAVDRRLGVAAGVEGKGTYATVRAFQYEAGAR